MSPLDLLALFCLYTSKEQREKVVASEFGTLTGDLGFWVEKLQANPVEAMRELILQEFGIEWDGVSGLASVVIESQRRAWLKILEKRQLLSERDRINMRLMEIQYSNISGE